MQQFRETVQTTRNGVVVVFPRPTVSVYLRETPTVLASIFLDDGTTPLSNPFVGTDLGLVQFYAANGRYNITFSKSGFTTVEAKDVLLDDASGTGGPGSVAASDITDSSSVGRSVITAADAAAARTALSAASQAAVDDLDDAKAPKTWPTFIGGILADFSNATLANRAALKSSTTDGNTNIPILPNGNAVSSRISVHNSSAIANAGVAELIVNAAKAILRASRNGTGTYLPLALQTKDLDRITIGVEGDITMPHVYVVKGTITAAELATQLASAVKTITFVGSVTIADDLTFPNGSKAVFAPGATVSVSSGKTLTFRGTVEAPLQQIFTGAGTVLGISRVKPEWWGAIPNDSLDCWAAMQYAQNCIEAATTSDGNRKVMDLGIGVYRTSRTILVSPGNPFKIEWVGAGGSSATYIRGLAAFTGTAVIHVTGNANTVSSTQFHIKGFRVLPQTAGTGATIGILVGGNATYKLIGGAGQHSSGFEDVQVYDFPICWRKQNALLLSYSRCAGLVYTLSAGIACQIIAEAGENTGDSEFPHCVFNATPATAYSMQILSFSTGVLSAIRFPGTILYYGRTKIVATGGSRLCDIWFNSGWQYDLANMGGFEIGAADTGTVLYNINFTDGYYAGGLTGNFEALNCYTLSGAKISKINFSRNFLIQTEGRQLFANGAGIQGVQFDDNVFADPNGGSVITIGAGVKGASVQRNIAFQYRGTNTIDSLVAILSGATFYSVKNNVDNGISTAAPYNDLALDKTSYRRDYASFDSAYAPGVTATTGAITTIGYTAATYLVERGFCTVSFDILITTNGTGSGSLVVGLPPGFPSSATAAPAYYIGTSRELTTGVFGVATITGAGATTFRLNTYNNTYPGFDTARIAGSIRYAI